MIFLLDEPAVTAVGEGGSQSASALLYYDATAAAATALLHSPKVRYKLDFASFSWGKGEPVLAFAQAREVIEKFADPGYPTQKMQQRRG